MRKLFIIISILIMGTISFAGYQQDMVKRMAVLEKRIENKVGTVSNGEAGNLYAELAEAWENELTKIYKLLMSKLTVEEQKKLRNEQRAWIKKKDNIPAEIEKRVQGTIAVTLAPSSLAEEVKRRSIELAKRYDKLSSKK